MPKGKVKFPLDNIGGTIWGPDRTIGRDVGLASSIRQVTKPSAADKKAGLKVQLYATTAPTRGGSLARHLRAKTYCDCDKAYKLLDAVKKGFLVPWYKLASGNPTTTMSAYNIYLKICMKGMIEYDVFTRFNWWSRYRIWNNSDTNWPNRSVILDEIPTYRADGADLRVYSLYTIPTKVSTKTFYAREIDARIPHTVPTPSQAQIIIESLQSQSSVLVDVYSFTDGEF